MELKETDETGEDGRMVVKRVEGAKRQEKEKGSR